MTDDLCTWHLRPRADHLRNHRIKGGSHIAMNHTLHTARKGLEARRKWFYFSQGNKESNQTHNPLY